METSKVSFSCALAPEPSTPAHVAVAEQLGFERVWCYDSPAVYQDVWMTLAIVAERTERIGLGPAVMVPSLRHPMVAATSIATLEERAPGRVAVAVGTGWSGRMTLGQPPMRWAEVRAYLVALRGLLAGDEVMWDGTPMQMMHTARHGITRPIETPIVVAADGPKGQAIADELGDGLLVALRPRGASSRHAWRAHLLQGAVLDAGETWESDRVVNAVGPAIANIYHGLYVSGHPKFDDLPGADAWRASVESTPADRRHLIVHEGHLTSINDHDRLIVREGVRALGERTLSGTPDQVASRIAELAGQGISEVIVQPTGPDPAHELERYAQVLKLI